MKLAVLFCFLCMFAVYSAQSASLYRWTDSEGRVQYSEQPPPADARNVEVKPMMESGAPQQTASLPYATRKAAANFPVTLYNGDCGEGCSQARAYLTKRGIPFSEKAASTPEVQAELRKLVGGLTVPVLVVGSSEPLKGFEAGRWDVALDAAGYPKNGSAVKSGDKNKQ